jgi:hypothetical protein
VAEALSIWDLAEASDRLGDVSFGCCQWTEDLRANVSTGDLADVIMIAQVYHRRFVVWIWEGDREVEPVVISQSDADVDEGQGIHFCLSPCQG